MEHKVLKWPLGCIGCQLCVQWVYKVLNIYTVYVQGFKYVYGGCTGCKICVHTHTVGVQGVQSSYRVYSWRMMCTISVQGVPYGTWFVGFFGPNEYMRYTMHT